MVVSSAILGFDCKVVLVGGKRYVISPPTIKMIAGASYYLSGIEDSGDTNGFLHNVVNSENLAHALSWFINGDDSLFGEMQHGTTDELIDGIEKAYSLISVQNFMKLSALARNVARLTAKQRP